MESLMFDKQRRKAVIICEETLTQTDSRRQKYEKESAYLTISK